MRELRRRERALLARIACSAPAPIRRAELTALLWGERDDARAKHALRQALFALRRVLGDALEVGPESVRLRSDAVALDVTALETELHSGHAWPPSTSGRALFWRAWRPTLTTLFDRGSILNERTCAACLKTRSKYYGTQRVLTGNGTTSCYVRAGWPMLTRGMRQRSGGWWKRSGMQAARWKRPLCRRASSWMRRRNWALSRLLNSWRSALRWRPHYSVRRCPNVPTSQRPLWLVEVQFALSCWAFGRALLAALRASYWSKASTVRTLPAVRRGSRSGFEPGPKVFSASGRREAATKAWSAASKLLAPLRTAPGLSGVDNTVLAQLAVLVPSIRERFRSLPETRGDTDAVGTAIKSALTDVAAEIPDPDSGRRFGRIRCREPPVHCSARDTPTCPRDAGRDRKASQT